MANYDPGRAHRAPHLPDGFVAVGGVFDARGADLAGLQESWPSPDDPRTWLISVKIMGTPGPDAALDYGAVCLGAEIVG